MSSQTNPAQPAWDEILAHFQVGTVRSMRPGGGTAAPKVLVETDRGRFLVRARRPQSSEDAVVAFDHSVIGALAQAGLPTVAPLPAYPTPNPTYSTGPTWVGDGQVAYEAFPFVEGLESFTPGDRDESPLLPTTRSPPPGDGRPPPRAASPGCVSADRRHVRHSAGHSGGLARGREQVDDARAMLSVAGAETLTANLVASLPQVIIHTDYTPANVMFEVPRLRHLRLGLGVSSASGAGRGEAMQFFAFRRPSPSTRQHLVAGAGLGPDLDGAPDVSRATSRCGALAGGGRRLALFMRETWLASGFELCERCNRRNACGSSPRN